MERKKREIAVQDFFVGEGHPLTVICGPCVIEGEDHCLGVAKRLKAIFSGRNLSFIFKSSFDKANRSSLHSFRGVGLKKGLKILERVKEEFGIPVCTDIHLPEQAKAVAEICDLIQIPAFLSRQTDLLLAAGETGKVISVKKGQFLAPFDMKNVVEKILSTGNQRMILLDRGTTFGYQNLVTDFRSIPLMQRFGFPVGFDATHSVQLSGGKGDSSGGEREFVFPLAKAAVAVGVDCLFLEVHPEPEKSKCDAATQVDLKDLPSFLLKLEQIYDVIREPVKMRH